MDGFSQSDSHFEALNSLKNQRYGKKKTDDEMFAVMMKNRIRDEINNVI